jgi:hypothetical protein
LCTHTHARFGFRSALTLIGRDDSFQFLPNLKWYKDKILQTLVALTSTTQRPYHYSWKLKMIRVEVRICSNIHCAQRLYGLLLAIGSNLSLPWDRKRQENFFKNKMMIFMERTLWIFAPFLAWHLTQPLIALSFCYFYLNKVWLSGLLVILSITR